MKKTDIQRDVHPETEEGQCMSLFLIGHHRWIHGLISGATFEYPVTLAHLCSITELSERTVKAIVESLGNEHDVPVGARRGKPNGYYIAQTVEEREAAARPLVSQGAKMIRRAGRLLGKRRVQELLGQGVL